MTVPTATQAKAFDEAYKSFACIRKQMHCTRHATREGIAHLSGHRELRTRIDFIDRAIAQLQT